MAIKPSPTIAGKLRKLFSNNKQTIEPAIGDSVPGGSGGGNVLTLHIGEKDGTYWAFKNSECTEGFESFEEARNAALGADIIKFFYAPTVYAYPVAMTIVDQMPTRTHVSAAITEESSNGPQLKPVYLYKYERGSQ